MTEAGWLVCEEPDQLLTHLGMPASDRKLCLFWCACCRRIWELLPVESREWVLASERIADTLASAAECAPIFRRAETVAQERGRPWQPDAFTYATASVGAPHATIPMAISAASTASMAVGCAAGETAPDDEYDAIFDMASCQETFAQAKLARDIFGNPFRPITFSPQWRTNTAMSLAHTMYESRDFSAMPILADALQDAGCDNEDILSHCRQPGEHVRGCWVVDALLGKE